MPRGVSVDPIYVYTIENNFAIKYDEPTDETITRENKNGHEVQLSWSYTKDNPGEMPDWEEVIIRGQATPDNTKQVQWFLNKLEEIKPRIRKAKAQLSGLDSGEEVTTANTSDKEDDLPF